MPRCGTASIPKLHDAVQPDPQAFRPPEDKVNVLQVRLPTNFKSARFESDAHTAILRDLEADIEAARFDTGDGEDRAAGEAQGARLDLRAAREVEHAAGRQLSLRAEGRHALRSRRPCTRDLEASRSVYNWVVELCTTLGADEKDLVPFEKYANAALSLVTPVVGGARARQRRAQHRARGPAGADHRRAEGHAVGRDRSDGRLVDSWVERNRKKAS